MIVRSIVPDHQTSLIMEQRRPPKHPLPGTVTGGEGAHPDGHGTRAERIAGHLSHAPSLTPIPRASRGTR
jgi:hypothetical protein